MAPKGRGHLAGRSSNLSLRNAEERSYTSPEFDNRFHFVVRDVQGTIVFEV